ncbi:hypothetical protein [Nocardioides hwasunensis]|uniref:Uncharacterized protein n=1 Tax=Nocardioides hwasunensis TaxID=397258 RepID=A0ABR8MI25_9ACTN|nr:hypothetical protein [Nocardioides hwasunensis]MBD3914355.1 hypothetical protein [Nocardioides hwasunensis]
MSAETLRSVLVLVAVALLMAAFFVARRHRETASQASRHTPASRALMGLALLALVGILATWLV